MMLETLEQHLEVFIKYADDVRLDTTISKHSPLCFEDVKTQGAFMIFSSAYYLGAGHAEKEMWERIK